MIFQEGRAFFQPKALLHEIGEIIGSRAQTASFYFGSPPKIVFLDISDDSDFYMSEEFGSYYAVARTVFRLLFPPIELRFFLWSY